MVKTLIKVKCGTCEYWEQNKDYIDTGMCEYEDLPEWVALIVNGYQIKNHNKMNEEWGTNCPRWMPKLIR